MNLHEEVKQEIKEDGLNAFHLGEGQGKMPLKHAQDSTPIFNLTNFWLKKKFNTH